MSMANESRQQGRHIARTASTALTGIADSAVTWIVWGPETILRIRAMVLTLVNSAVSAVVRFDRRITPGSDTGRIWGLDGTTILAGNGVLIIPTATAVGKTIYKDVRVDVQTGDEIVPTITTAATVAGAVAFSYEFINRHETALNQSDMVLSA
jgi:hypothetical protein